jgi:hypothetical protein
MLPVKAEPSSTSAPGIEQPVEGNDTPSGVSSGGRGVDELVMDLGVVAITALLVTGIVVLRRWLTLRSRKPHPALPRERLLSLSRHDALHDPKYLGRILEDDEPPRRA